MKEAELSLVLKYFLAWYEFHLEQRHIKEVAFDPVAENHTAPVTFSSKTNWRPSDMTVNRMQQELQPAVRRHMARLALLAELFQRWRNATLERRHSPVSRLTDPDVITNFVRRLQEQVLGEYGAENLPAPPSADIDVTHCPRSVPESPRANSHRAAPRQSPSQRASPQRPAIAVCPGGDIGADRRDIVADRRDIGADRRDIGADRRDIGADRRDIGTGRWPPSLGPASAAPPPSGRPHSAGGDSTGSVGLCAEIMTTHALRLARRRPEPDSASEAELRRAPHLHSYLMNAHSNRRQRPAALAPAPAAAAAAAAAAAVRPPYQELLERKAELRRARQKECRRRRLEREAANREAERQRHDEFQQQLALERQQQQEQLRQRRQRQEELRHRQLRGHQLLQQQQVLADNLRRRALVRRMFRALVRHTQRSRQLESAAELWARSTLLRRCLHRWRHHRALVAAERDEAAHHWHRTRLAAWGLNRWRRYVHQQQLKAQAATDLSQLQRLQAALRAWHASLALSRVRRRQKMQHAALCDVRLTCAGALRRWRRLRHVLEQEQVIKARKDRLRRIVREMVPDFQPAAAAAAAAVESA